MTFLGASRALAPCNARSTAALSGPSTTTTLLSVQQTAAPAAAMPSMLVAAAWTLFPRMPAADLIPSILMVGKRRTSGKSKRHPKPANHGAVPATMLEDANVLLLQAA
eukprot:CAMPEP_0115875540 /NCGR_PEP_ID=MMETSP0287-20121206/25151_1 /TAXON_ID=412157 /ORGANISM="Chrysochromulina rotalis, Strain UIO044" /LENGTH=107 /DNA_ID=CAMNT_0003330809 /DNA_START=64 /DNA_END=388 /DNA_ORIENTATION=+